MGEIFKTDIEILKEIVGDSLYSKIKNEFAGRSIYIPKLNKEIDYSQIYLDMEKGISFKLIAKKYGYTLTWVQHLYRNYLKEKYPKKEIIQHSLF